MADALAVLKAKRAELGTEQVANDLGYSQSAIRTICTGHYRGDPGKVLTKVLAVYVNVIACPHVRRDIPVEECQVRAHAPQPFGGSAKLAWWQACQNCCNRNLDLTGVNP